MCIKRIKEALKSKPRIPHPEEKLNYHQTVSSVSIYDILTKWMTGWEVPVANWDYWRRSIVITVRADIANAAQTSDGADGARHLEVRPEWLNPGVIAHEQAHNSYALLPLDEKISFAAVYHTLSDPLIDRLWITKLYGKTNDVEAHAEIYRFIGQKMPEVLKSYYPKLF